MAVGTVVQEGRRPAARCDCCRERPVQPAFAIALPAGGRTRRICTRCASHISLKADGEVWMPRTCPDAPRPRLRVFHSVEGVTT